MIGNLAGGLLALMFVVTLFAPGLTLVLLSAAAIAGVVSLTSVLR